MKRVLTVAAVLAMSAVFVASAPNEAKADGGVTVAVGVGAYLVGDAIVGRECHIRSWPFNIFTKIGDELHGRRGCHRAYYHRRHRHHR